MTTKNKLVLYCRKTVILPCLFILFSFIANAQEHHGECHHIHDSSSSSSFFSTNLSCGTPGPDNSENGKIHTPKGSLKMLVVFASFQGYEDSYANAWPIIDEATFNGYNESNNFGMPLYVSHSLEADGNYSTNTTPLIFNNESDFTNPALMSPTSENESISRVYNTASKPKEDFQITGDVFKRDGDNAPMIVRIDPSDPDVSSISSWHSLNKHVLEQLPDLNPNFPMEDYDLRENAPYWQCDNSANETPDGKVDFVIIVYRFARNFASEPISGMNNWIGSSVGGFNSAGPSVDWDQDLSIGGSSGSTIITGAADFKSIFIHEFAHQLYDCPHYGGTNGVAGKYYNYNSTGWGSTAYPGVFKNTMNSWERWYLNYINPVEVNSDATFELEDYLTSQNSDKIAARIAIPFSDNQYLWIENHQKIHTFDNFRWWNNGTNQIGPDNVNVPNTDAGLYMFVEDMADDRSDVGLVYSGANSFKFMNARGRWDFEADLNTPPVFNNWGNELLRFNRNDENPIGGINTWGKVRGDYDNNQSIGYTSNYNNGGPNEGKHIIREFANGNDEYTYASWGTNSVIQNYNRTPAFQANDILNMGSNPTILNYPTFNTQLDNLNPYYLNGLEVKILSSGANASIEVKYKQTEIDDDVRWTGNIILPNITEDDAADLELAAGKEILLNMSKVASRRTPHPTLGGFANPTQFRIASGAKLHLREGAILRITEHSTLTIENGAEVILEDNAQIIIEETGHLIMEGNNITLNGNDARLVVKGTLETTENINFSFDGAGYVQFFNTHTLILGNGSNFDLDGQGIYHRFIKLEDGTTLDVSGHGLYLKDGHIKYEAETKIFMEGGSVSWNAVSTYHGALATELSAEGLLARDLTSCSIRNCDINRLERGIVISANSGTIPIIRDNVFRDNYKGLYASRYNYIFISDNEFTNNVEVSVRLNLIEKQAILRNNIITSDGNYGVGYNFTKVNIANISGGLVDLCSIGVIADESNVLVKQGATISRNLEYGVFMENKTAEYMLSVGRCGCGNIINNNIGVKGRNIVLDIDGIIHQMECDVKVPVANRFDGNDVIFDICYNDPTFISNTSTILMRHNYWGGQSLSNYSYSLPYGNSPDFCPSNGSSFSFPVDASQYVTNLSELKNCGENKSEVPPKVNEEEYDDKTRRATACEIESKGENFNLRSQSKTAFRLLREDSYNEALKEYSSIAELWSKNNGYSDQCNNMISVANCLTKSYTRFDGTRSKENVFLSDDLLSASDYIISPNPACDFINVSCKMDTENEQVYLIDLYGRIIQEMPLQKEMRFPLSDIADGIYILKVMTSKGLIKHTEKVVIAKCKF